MTRKVSAGIKFIKSLGERGMSVSSFVFWAMLLCGSTALAFQSKRPASLLPRPFSQLPPTDSKLAGEPLQVMRHREADYVEMMVGGERYEMVPLPDRMMDTTIFVGNICEFTHDEDLSKLFQAVSQLQSVPACVARKANMASLQYGFVSFPTVEEKEAAILRFHGTEWRGKRIKVEAIRDDPSLNRVKVPERMVAYVSGEAKKTRNGKVNAMRRNGRDAYGTAGMRKSKKVKKANKKQQQAQKRSLASKLTVLQKEELQRAAKKGFVTLDGRAQGHRPLSTLCSSKALKASRLATAHRHWCDEREKPNIILYKAGRTTELDHVVVDLSPLRLNAFSNEKEDNNRQTNSADDDLVKWKRDILSAANSSGMKLKITGETEECSIDCEDCNDLEALANEYIITLDKVSSEKWRSRGHPISKLPIVSMGLFVGERTNAKAMARELANLWDLREKEEIPEVVVAPSSTKSPAAKRFPKKKVAPHTQERKRAQRRQQRHDLEELLNRYG